MSDHALPGFGRYIVTVKLPQHPDHNPRDKKTDGCVASRECTDATGAHHSFIVETDRLHEVLARYAHVTRVERVTTVHRHVPDDVYKVLCGLSGSELLLRSDLARAALDAYSLFTVKTVGDHGKAIKAAVAAALLRMSEEERRLNCSCGGNTPEGVSCPSCSGPLSDEAGWLRVTALRLDPGILTRDID